MGIKLGNTFITKHCKKDIHKIDFGMLKNMTLVIDTSIYMYRFLEDDRLENNFNLLVNIFKTHNITPIFVFDGWAKENKRATLRERERCRRYAEYEYKETQDKLTNAKSSLEKLYIATELAAIKRRTVRVTVMVADEPLLLFIETYMFSVLGSSLLNPITPGVIRTA